MNANSLNQYRINDKLINTHIDKYNKNIQRAIS
jgi:hypothetical protein